MVTIAWQSKNILNLSWVTNMTHFLIKWTLKRERSQKLSCWGHGVAHEVHGGVILMIQDKFKILMLCHAMVTVLVYDGLFWSVLVHVMGNPTTLP